MRRSQKVSSWVVLVVIAGIIGLLAVVSTLRDYKIVIERGRPVLSAKINVPRPGSVHITADEPGKITVTTSNLGSRVAGYEFETSRFSNMAFAHSFRSVEPKKTIAKLKEGKRYYVRVRCYKANQMGRVVFGRWSSINSAMVKEE